MLESFTLICAYYCLQSFALGGTSRPAGLKLEQTAGLCFSVSVLLFPTQLRNVFQHGADLQTKILTEGGTMSPSY